MAKKKNSKKGDTKWQPAPNDAIQLSALRWFALTIEKASIELYATNSKSYIEMVKLLRKTLDAMGDLREDFGLANEDDCPEGYVLCTNGLCQPACDRLSNPDFDVD